MSHTGGVEIRPEYRAVATELASRIPAAATQRLVIGVAGESGSGKTITALCLADAFAQRGRRVVCLHQDDYFLLPPRANHRRRVADLACVGPHEVNLALLARHVAAFRAGQAPVPAPCVDWPNDRFLTRPLDFSAADLLIVEGTYTLLLDDLDVRVFLAATHHDTRERRQARNRDVSAPVMDDILSIEHALIAPQEPTAHIVVDRDFAIIRSP